MLFPFVIIRKLIKRYAYIISLEGIESYSSHRPGLKVKQSN